MGLAVAPEEADSPLVVDADAVLAGAVALQGFEGVAGRNAKIVKALGGMEKEQLATGRDLDISVMKPSYLRIS